MSEEKIIEAITTIFEEMPKLAENKKESILLNKKEWDIMTEMSEDGPIDIIYYNGVDVDDIFLCLGQLSLTTDKTRDILKDWYEDNGWLNVYKEAISVWKGDKSAFFEDYLVLSDCVSDSLTRYVAELNSLQGEL